jgi:hypothetical protein
MTAIGNQWTGNGANDGDALTSGNVNAAGNGATVTRSVSGTPTWTFAGDGFNVQTATSADIARLDATLGTSSAAIRGQIKLTVGVAPSAGQDFYAVRNSGANMATVVLNTGRTIQFTGSGTLNSSSLTPAVALGDVLLVDVVLALAASPTTSNGRIFYQVTNLTNTSWNTTGVFFYDTLYTTNIGLTNATGVRMGKTATGTFASPGLTFEFLGWEGITVNPADTSSAAAKAYFADAPATVVQLATPVVNLDSSTNATTTGGTDGTATVSWSAIAHASAYKVELAAGADATSGFTTKSSAATSPYTVTGLAAGAYTIAVTATP